MTPERYAAALRHTARAADWQGCERLSTRYGWSLLFRTIGRAALRLAALLHPPGAARRAR